MNILHEIVRGVWMIEPEYARAYKAQVLRILSGEANKDIRDFASSSDDEEKNQKIPFAQFATVDNNKVFTSQAVNIVYNQDLIPENTISVINISGAITKYNQFCGPRGMLEISRYMQTADQHENVIAHLVVLDTGGGEGMAARLMSEIFSTLSKPVIAQCDDFTASAGYYIASAASHISANSKATRMGSIGTYLCFYDDSAHLEKEGFKEIIAYADESVDKNKVFYDAIKGDTKPLKQLATDYNQFFLQQVEKGREGSLTADRKVWGTGKMFWAEEMLALGLIDEICTQDELLIKIYNEYKK
jgi:protease-4